MKIAYFSPLNPQPSGISDYSEELLPFLSKGADISLFVDGFTPAGNHSTAQLQIYDYRRYPSVLSDLPSFDAIVYHMGNDHRYHTGMFQVMQEYPGIVVFHDFALQDFFLGLARERNDPNVYLDEVIACHGAEPGLEVAQELIQSRVPSLLARPLEYPLNARLARAAEAIVVHSRWTEARFRKIAPSTPVSHIPMAVRVPPARQQLNGSGQVQIASFGLITPGKGIELGLRALAQLKSTHDFRYTLVGAPNAFFEIRERIRKNGLEDRVNITGHLPMAEFEALIGKTDIALNIRERTVGETSASLCRLMSAGVCSIVADVGWYAELPDNAVVKLPLGQDMPALLVAYLRRLIEDSKLRHRIGENAQRYAVREHNLERAAASYLNVIETVVGRRTRKTLVASVATELTSLGIKDADKAILTSVAQDVALIAPPIIVAPNVSQSNGSDHLRRPSIASDSSTPIAAAADAELTAGRFAKIEGIDYKRAAIEYLGKLSDERRHHLRTKPFYNLAHKPAKYKREGMEEDMHRHFCDFANMAMELALPPGSRILDVGCGSGWLSEYFARLGYHVKGIDISAELIEMSRERVARVPYGVDHETPLACVFEVHDIEAEPLREKFDAVICYDSLHHFEDEHAVMRHLAAMLPIGGQLFVLEGQRPTAGSSTESELQSVMREFETLESPFESQYLRQLLDEHGFAVVGDYVSVNGFFERDMLEDDRLPLKTLPTNHNYLICLKVCEGAAASTVPNSRRPGVLAVRFALSATVPSQVAAGATLTIPVSMENVGDTLWLTGQTVRAGVVMPAVRIFDDRGTLIHEFHGEPLLRRAVAPGETMQIKIEYVAPRRRGPYTMKIDLVDQHVSWFEQQGSEPLIIRFDVV